MNFESILYPLIGGILIGVAVTLSPLRKGLKPLC